MPQNLRMKAQIVIEELSKFFLWDIQSGELIRKKDMRKVKNSNIVHIIRHAVDGKTSEPEGYSQISKFLLKGSTKPSVASQNI